MIPAHGGVLVNRLLPRKGEALWQERFPALPQVPLNARQLSDLLMLASGVFSPLDGFMGREAYQSVVRSMRLPNGLPWPMPVTLAVSQEMASSLKVGDPVGLVDPEGNPAGVLHLEECYPYNKEDEARQVYRTTDLRHPGVRIIHEQGDILLGGKIEAFAHPVPPLYAGYPSTPRESRQFFAQLGWQTIAGFQTRNPIHRAHEYLQKCAMEVVDGLLIHPLVGETQPGDIPADVRMRCYEVLLKDYYPHGRAVLGVYPAFMRYAGPREAILHALVRKNYGCTHFIVGRDHAGVGNYYGPYDAQHIFREFQPQELGITPLFFENSFFCTRCGNMATNKTCPHGADVQINLSGTQVREMLRQGKMPPPEFTRPEVALVLMEAMVGAR